jgi:hypothetical protein
MSVTAAEVEDVPVSAILFDPVVDARAVAFIDLVRVLTPLELDVPSDTFHRG